MYRCVIPEAKARTVNHKGRLSTAQALYGTGTATETAIYRKTLRCDQTADLILTTASEFPEIPTYAELLSGISSTIPASSPSSPSSSGSVFSISGVSTDSPSRKLFTSELCSSLATNILDSCTQDLASVYAPIDDFVTLFNLFLASGRQIERMPTNPQILLWVLLALGSRLSSHSAIIGSDPPAMEKIYSPSNRGTWYGDKMLTYGSRREYACRHFLERARTVLDLSGASLKDPDFYIIAALSQIELLGLGERYCIVSDVTSREIFLCIYSHTRAVSLRRLEDEPTIVSSTLFLPTTSH